MPTQVIIEKLDKEVSALRDDVRAMQHFLLAMHMNRDNEGEYRKSFIKKVRARSRSKGPFYTLTDKKSFLAHVRKEE